MSTPPALHLMPPAVAPHFGRALGGIWRLAWRRVYSPLQMLIVAVALALLALLVTVSLRGGAAEQFNQWAVGFYLMALVPVTAFLSGAGAIRDDMKGVAVDYILTRPVRRWAYVAGKYACHTVCVLGLHLLALATLLGVGYHRGVPDLGAAMPDFLGALVLAVAAFTALGFVCGAVTARYLVLGIVYAFIIEIGLGRIPIQLSKLSVLRHLKTVLADVAPEAGVSAAGGGPTAVLLVMGFTLLWVGAAAILFSLQEFAGQRPKEG